MKNSDKSNQNAPHRSVDGKELSINMKHHTFEKNSFCYLPKKVSGNSVKLKFGKTSQCKILVMQWNQVYDYRSKVAHISAGKMDDLAIIQVHFPLSILQEIREECLAIFRLNGTGIIK